MSGVAVVRHLLANNAAFVAEVPAARTFGGPIPQAAALPAVGVTLISGMPALPVANAGTKRLHTDRVQVTVHADDYAAKVTILSLAIAAIANRQGVTNGVDLDSILLDIEGPDLDDPGRKIFRRSRDFLVRWRST